MKRSLWIASCIGLTAALAGLWLFQKESVRPTEKKPSIINNIPLLPGESLRSDWPQEEVFRRAFWRHPASGDRILQAVRFESSGADGVSRWAWFIKLHPSAELLRDLRNPSTFGVIPTDKPKPSLPGDISRPDWYPELSKDAGAEILQHPSQSLTLQYHAKENLLYVSDYGEGFAKGLSN